MRDHDRLGYTLIELVVVVMLIGVLASVGIPQYLKTVEIGKADDAVSTTNMVGTTNKMFALDHGGCYAAGNLAATCGTGTCNSVSGTAPGCGGIAPCQLVYCKYLADQDWANKPYAFYACDTAGNGGGNCGSATSSVSSSARATTGTQATTSSPYSGWGYVMTSGGVITTIPASGSNAPPLPSY